jgi:hypothetical protein
MQRDRVDARLLVRDVRRERLGPELFGGGCELVGPAGDECQPVALLLEHPREREPDPRRASRDERRFHAREYPTPARVRPPLGGGGRDRA